MINNFVLIFLSIYIYLSRRISYFRCSLKTKMDVREWIRKNINHLQYKLIRITLLNKFDSKKKYYRRSNGLNFSFEALINQSARIN